MANNYSKFYIKLIFKIGKILFAGLNRISLFFYNGRNTPKNILIVKTHAIGDVLLITPSIRYIREKFPESRISMLVGKWSKEVVVGNPYIDKLITFDDSILLNKKVIEFLKLIFQLRKEKYDLCILFHCNPIIHLIAFFIGSSQRMGFEEGNSGFSLTHKVPMEQGLSGRYMGDIYFDLVDPEKTVKRDMRLTLVFMESEKNIAQETLKKYGVTKNSFFVSIAPGGGMNPRENVLAKRWLPSGFKEVAKSIINDFNGKVLILGSSHDRDVGEEISTDIWPKPVNLCGLVTLRQSAALIGESNLLITNDSAPHHIAVALCVPSITIFGPTMPETFIPEHGRDKHLYVKSKLDCSPCYKGLFPGCKEPKCMEYVSANEVIFLIKKILINQNTTN